MSRNGVGLVAKLATKDRPCAESTEIEEEKANQYEYDYEYEYDHRKENGN